MKVALAIGTLILLGACSKQPAKDPLQLPIKPAAKIYFQKHKEPYKAGHRPHCSSFSDPTASNRCEAAKYCIQRGELFFQQKIKEQPHRKAKYYQALGDLYSSQEVHLYKAIVNMRKANEEYKKLGKRKYYLSTLAKLGIFQLKLAEVRNCVSNHNQDSCHFPLSENAVHKDKEGSKGAIKSFLEFLKEKPNHYHIKWLLNVAYMTLGQYPDKVPAEYLIEPKYFESKMKFKKFTDIGAKAGIQTVYQQSGGAVLDDFDNDGELEIILTSRGACDQAVYFDGHREHGFMNHSEESGLSKELTAGHLIQADFDNDGDLDLYLTRGAWDMRSRDHGIFKNQTLYSSLMENNGKGQFTNITKKAGLMADGPNTVVAAHWADFNNDGWIDLFVCNELRQPDLYINNKDGTFTNKIKKSGISNHSRCKGSSVGDINNDGYEDIYIANNGYFEKAQTKNQLYLNNKDLTFTNVTSKFMAENPQNSFPAMMFDFNNDGNLDIYVSVFIPNMHDYVKQMLGEPHNGELPRLFIGDGTGVFKDQTKEVGHDFANMAMGLNFGDYNNDGFDDFFIGSGHSSFGHITPNHAFYNDEGKKLIDITTAGNFGNLQKGHAISFADFDRDGDQDLLVQMGGTIDSDRFFPLLYENPGFKNSWINIKFEGVKSNRSAIGTKVRFDFRDGKKTRSVYKWVTSGSSFGTNSLELEAGLRKAKIIDKITVWWPASGIKQEFKDVAINQFLHIKEGEKLIVRKLSPFKVKGDSGQGHHHHHH